MHQRTNYLIAGIILVVFGFAFMLGTTGIINLNTTLILSYAAAIYGLSTVYIYMGTSRNGRLFWGTLIFMAGVLLMTINYFPFPDLKSIIIPSSMFIAGAGFFILFINNSANRVFLYTALTLVILTGGYVWAARNFAFIMMANNFSRVLYEYYPLVIILIGVVLLYGKKKLF